MGIKSKSKKVVELQRQREVMGVEEAPTYYSNSVEIATSLWDIRIRFGELKEASREHLIVKNLATVYLSPAHAKAVSVLLAEKIKDYELTFGAIPTAPISPDTAEK
ncbi:DUF3467 domain-containing protein [Nitrospira sp. Ecomares 2.1]